MQAPRARPLWWPVSVGGGLAAPLPQTASCCRGCVRLLVNVDAQPWQVPCPPLHDRYPLRADREEPAGHARALERAVECHQGSATSGQPCPVSSASMAPWKPGTESPPGQRAPRVSKHQQLGGGGSRSSRPRAGLCIMICNKSASKVVAAQSGAAPCTTP